MRAVRRVRSGGVRSVKRGRESGTHIYQGIVGFV